MEIELIKLKVKKEASFGIDASKIKSAFVESCLRLNDSIFEPLINEKQYFQDLDKYHFLASLKQ
jgi:hypothetical protein